MRRPANVILDEEFYCVFCGEKGIPIARKKGSKREPGHLKKLFCLNCKKEVNFCEINPFAQNYTKEDFFLEWENGNFDKEGKRILPFKEFKQKLVKNGKLK